MTPTRQLARAAALLLPLSLVLAGTGTALAAKPVRTPPPVLTGRPANPSASPAATFAWTAATGTTYTCSLDGQKATACTSPRSYASLADGSHAFTLRATGSTGGSRTGVTSYGWRVDTVAPPAPAIGSVPSPTRATAASVAFGDAESGVSFRCALDGAAGTACTSPYGVSGLTEGVHVLVVSAQDAAGNSTPATVAWTVDHTAPSIPVVVSPASPTRSTSVDVVFSDAEAAAFTCALDGASAQPCTSPVTLLAPGEGAHTLAVTPYDAAGNAGAAGSAAWVVDLTPPTGPGVVTGPAALTNQTSGDVLFADGDPSAASFGCAVDGAAAVPCSSPFTVTGLAEGPHSVAVTASDLAGNTSPPTTAGWTVDLTAPTPAVIGAGPGSPSNDTMPTFVIESPDGSADAFSCTLDGGAPFVCDTGEQPTVSGEGAHVLEVASLDAAGNASSPVRWTWVLDTTPPPAVQLTGPDALVASSTATLAFSTSEPEDAFVCALDGGAPSSCSSPLVLHDLADGDHALAVTAVDRAGNRTSATWSWAVDTVAPAAPAVSSSPTTTSSGDVTVTLSDAPAGTTYTCSLDGGPATACTNPVTYTDLAPGTHTVDITVIDAAGNSTAVPTQVFHVVESAQAPAPLVVSVPGGDAAAPVTTAPVLTLTSADPTVTGYQCSVDGAAYVSCATGFTPATTADGAHTVDVVAVHEDGSVSEPVQYGYVLDTTAPAATVAAPTTLTGPTTLVFSEDVLGAGGITLQVPGATTVPVAVSCRDAAGTAVACTGAVRSVALTPRLPLVPGQRYAASLPASVTDAAGNAATLTATPFRAALVQQESSPALGMTWRTQSSSAAIGGRYVVAHLAGASASYAFRGTSVVWYTATGPTMGTARVYVDGVLKATVNDYAASSHWRVPRSVRGLASGSHVLKVVATGRRGSTAGQGTQVVVDAVRVGSTVVANPALRPGWASAGASAASGGRYAVADQAGEAATMTFRGTRLTLWTATGRSMGRAKVYVDGVLKATLDNYGTSTYTARRLSWGLTDRVHTVRVVVLGTHRAGATGNRVVLDALVVR